MSLLKATKTSVEVIVMAGKILIVDDQKGVRRLLEELFRREGWDVRCAGDGLEAIAKVEEQLPDLILMDVKMPNMNGLEATHEIMEKNPNIPIIMMTAYGEIEVVKQALDAGVKRCISKPFDIMLLREMVSELMGVA
jgi:two-component system response regulator (stage 0 sporulation protein F)